MDDFAERISKLSPKRLALLALELRAKLEALERAQAGSLRTLAEPIAIIGMGCRYPGDANSPDAYWRLLRDGVDAVTEVPAQRWDVNAYYDPDPDAPGKMASRWGGFISDVDQFDPSFFGIAPREAMSMDPQQRLLLEVGWEALEYAGYAPDKLAGSSTGVFVGICNSDYFNMQVSDGNDQVDAYLATGSASSIASGRLSYVLGLQGPSLSIDTACSSSLVAVHLAVQSLRNGECRMALAGGVNLVLSPNTTVTLSKAKMMAPDGRCKTFDASADGFVRAEGCGVVVLKRLSDALSEGDQILAVIRGTAVNQDGRSNGLTAPNGPSQVAVIRQALANAGVAPSDLSYVETHGTGTSLGDPIEVQALGAVFAPGRTADDPLTIGSVKTNIGHTEAAAGIAGIIKVVLALQHGEIPPHLHLKQLSPFIPWDEIPVTIPTERVPWVARSGRRIAGVSSFGFSGTNAHVILEAAPQALDTTQHESHAPTDRPSHVLCLSAKSQSALKDLAWRYERHLELRPDIPFADIAFTANTGRSHFAHRLSVIAADAEQARQALAAYGAGQAPDAILQVQAPGGGRPQLAFLFTGQGAQYVGMARQLYQTQPVFHAVVDRCNDLLRPYLERPLLSVIYPEPSQDSHLDETAYTQPALFVIEYGLAELWRSWGVRPTAVAGHSVGEYVAACVAGVFSLEDGLKLIAERGRLMQALPANGEMAAVFVSVAHVTQAIAAEGDRVSIAAINGPGNIVISGERAAVQSVIDRLQVEGIKARRLAVSIASHSPLMDPMLDEFERVAQTVTYSAPQIEFVSGINGQLAGGAEVACAGYWRRHARETVRFAGVVETLHGHGYRLFVEAGPAHTLIGMARRCLPDEGRASAWLPSLRPGRSDWQQMLTSLGTLYAHGVDPDWAAFDRGFVRRRVALPTYPFQRERYWFTEGAARGHAESTPRHAPRDSTGQHPLLGERLQSPALQSVVFETRLSTDWPPFLSHHHVYGMALLPSPAYIEMVLAGAAEAFGSAPRILTNLAIHEALLLPDASQAPRSVQLVLGTPEGDAATFQVFSRADAAPGWTLHATGSVHLAQAGAEQAVAQPAFSAEVLQARCTEQLSGDAYYDRLWKLGLEFGSHFRGITNLWRRDGEALGRVQLPDGLSSEADKYHIHPAFLDACFHLLGAALPNDGSNSTYLLIGIDSFRLYSRPGRWLWNHTVLQTIGESNRETFSGDIRLYDESGRLVAEALGLHLKRASRETLLRATRKHRFSDWLYEVRWQPKDLPLAESAGIRSPADWLPTLDRIMEQSPFDTGTHSAQGTRDTLSELKLYETLLPELDRLATGYIVRALQQLGWRLRSGEHVSAAVLTASLGIVERQHRLLGRLLEVLGEEGLLRRSEDDWEVNVDRFPETSDVHAQLALLLARYPAAEAEITLTGLCGESLAGALRGEVDPLQLLFPNGSLALTTKLYTESPFARVYNRLIQRAFSAAVAALPEGRTVRILEIGAGTGGTTSYLLGSLPAGQTEYVFTDVSPLFLTRAEEKYREFPFMRYRLLDIGCDPGGQGFAPHQFDIILASNVLHATEDLRRTLQHVQQLLAPRGLFFLLEGTRPQRWVDITFGLTEGWWAFNDANLRPSYPLLSRNKWLGLLEDAGFSAPVAIPVSVPVPSQGSLPSEPSDGSAETALDMTAQALLLARGLYVGEMEPSKAQHGRWIIFADQGGVGDHLAKMIEARGGTCALIRSGIAFRQEGTERWQIDPAYPEHYHQVLREALGDPRRDIGVPQTDVPAPTGVVYLWGLDSTPADATTLDSLQTDVSSHCISVLHLLQTLLQEHVERSAVAPIRLWLVTRHAQPVDEDHATPESTQAALEISQAPLWGLGRVIALEHPEWWGGLIDLAPDQTTFDAVTSVLSEITGRDGEDQVAFRKGRRYVPRIVTKVKALTAPVISWKAVPNAIYLITGGLGGLGIKVARWMAERGARHLVLLGRTGLPPRDTWSTLPEGSDTHRRITAIQEIERLGAHVTLEIADVGDKVRMTSLFERFGDTLPPLRGIVHAAFAPGAHPLTQMPAEALLDMLHPKVTGAWVLHELTRQMDLDFFVSFSSTTSLWGSRDMAHYAAANQFLDAFAHYRRANGMPALTVNWGIWDEMRVASSAERNRVMQFGLRPMPSDQALEALGELLGRDDITQVAVAAVDWGTLKAAYEAKRARPFLSEVQVSPTTRGVDLSESGGYPATAPSGLSERVRNLQPDERHEIVVECVHTAVCKVLGMNPAHPMDEKQGLFEMGMDSLMSIELKSHLEASVGRSLPSTLTFNYPTIEDLARYIETQVLAKQTGATTGLSATPAPAPLQQDNKPGDEGVSDGLSEDELAVLLARKLEQIR